MKDHKCWASSHQVDIRAAKSQMYEMVAKDPTRSLLEIYEVVRQKYTAQMHFELRYKIVCEGYDLFMATNKPSWHTEISIMEWRMKMLNPKEWGDETVLVLASEFLHVDIQLIPAFGEVTIIKSSSESSQKQLFSLFYFSEVDFYSGHYQSVKPSLPVSNSPSLAASFSPSLPISFSLDDIEVTDD